MHDFELFAWIILLLLFTVIPLKPLYHLFLSGLGIEITKDTTPFLGEDRDNEQHYAQLYRPGDRKYNKIVELCEKAKSVN
jgi:hypothetical protein